MDTSHEVARHSAGIPRALSFIADAISQRLETCVAVATDMVTDDYAEDAWNGRSILRLELSEPFAMLINRDDDPFTQEMDVLRQIEIASSEALAWDGAGYAWPEFLGERGVGHYLCDLTRAEQIMTAIAQIPVVSDAQRAAAREDFQL